MDNMWGFSILGVYVCVIDYLVEIEDYILFIMERWIYDVEVVFEILREFKRIFLVSDNYEIIVCFGEYFGKNKVWYEDFKIFWFIWFGFFFNSINNFYEFSYVEDIR